MYSRVSISCYASHTSFGVPTVRTQSGIFFSFFILSSINIVRLEITGGRGEGGGMNASNGKFGFIEK